METTIIQRVGFLVFFGVALLLRVGEMWRKQGTDRGTTAMRWSFGALVGVAGAIYAGTLVEFVWSPRVYHWTWGLAGMVLYGLSVVLRLTAERAPAPQELEFRAPAFDPQRQLVQITVADNGPGLAPGLREKLFTPGSSTKQDGNGLGLALVAELVGRHGGAIGVQSEPGVGTTFSVYLPLAL
jgi:hypothetical protein